MPTYNRRDFALTFARDRRCGTVRRILDFAARQNQLSSSTVAASGIGSGDDAQQPRLQQQGMRPDTIFWAPAPLRSVINGIHILLQQRGVTPDVLLYVFSFLNTASDLDAMGWRLPLPRSLSHPANLPASVTAQIAQIQHQHPSLNPLPSSLYSESNALRLYRCSLYPPKGPSAQQNLLIARVLTPHRHLSNEELNMYLGRYGFVDSVPLSADGFVVSESETAAANPHRGGQIRVLYFLVQVDSAQLAARAIESCLVAQIDFLSWAVQVPYDLAKQESVLEEEAESDDDDDDTSDSASSASSESSDGDDNEASGSDAGEESKPEEGIEEYWGGNILLPNKKNIGGSSNKEDANEVLAEQTIMEKQKREEQKQRKKEEKRELKQQQKQEQLPSSLSVEEQRRLRALDCDPCVFPLSCIPPPGKMWMSPLVDIDCLVRRRRQRAAAEAKGAADGIGGAHGNGSTAFGMGIDGAGGVDGWNIGGGGVGGAGGSGTGGAGSSGGAGSHDDDYLSDIRLLPEIIVDGIPYWVTDETLLTRCAEFGNVKRIRFSTCDRTGVHHGCAAVSMGSVSEAVRLHDHMDGRIIEGGTVRCGILEAYAHGDQVRYRLVSLRTGRPVYDDYYGSSSGNNNTNNNSGSNSSSNSGNATTASTFGAASFELPIMDTNNNNTGVLMMDQQQQQQQQLGFMRPPHHHHHHYPQSQMQRFM